MDVWWWFIWGQGVAGRGREEVPTNVLYLDLGGRFTTENSSSPFLYVRIKYRN